LAADIADWHRLSERQTRFTQMTVDVSVVVKEADEGEAIQSIVLSQSTVLSEAAHSTDPLKAVATTPYAGDSDKAKDGVDAADVPSIFSVLWVALLCVFVDFLGLAISIPLLPYYTLELPWDASTQCPSCPQDASVTDFSIEGRCGEVEGCGTALDVGLCMSAFYGGQIVGNLFMSWLSDRVGRKVIIMISLAGSALGYLGCGLAPNLYWLYTARTFTGIAGGTLPVVQAMILDVTGDPRERPKYFGIAGACLGLAFMVGPGLGAGFAVLINKQAGLMSPAIIALSVIIVGFFRIHETRPTGGMCGPRSAAAAAVHDDGAAKFGAFLASLPAGPSSGPPAAKGSSDKSLPKTVYACAMAMALASFSFTSMTSMTALSWPIAYNLGPGELGIFLTVVGALGIINNVVVIKFLAAKIGSERVVLIASLVLGFGISSYTFIDLADPGNTLIFIPYLFFFFLCICVPWDMHMPNLITIAGNAVPPHLRGRTTGLVASGMSFGFALCPLAAGPLFGSDVLRLEHEYGSFSHIIWIICGVVSVVEFILLAVVVGCGRKEA